MKKYLLLATAAISLCASAKTDVSALAVGSNVYLGHPSKIVLVDAVSTSETASVTLKLVSKVNAYDVSVQTVTNSFTNLVSWTTQTVTSKVVSVVADYLTVTNSVFTNVVDRSTGLSTNIVYYVTQTDNGSHLVTNDVVTVKPVWTSVGIPYVTATVTNDVVSTSFFTNTIGTISLSGHVGSLVPTNSVFVNAGDVVLVESSDQANVRLWTSDGE